VTRGLRPFADSTGVAVVFDEVFPVD
jgi:hypothetical protein